MCAGPGSGPAAASGLQVLCVSPYPHHLKERPTNSCLYWLGRLQNDQFQMGDAEGGLALQPGCLACCSTHCRTAKPLILCVQVAALSGMTADAAQIRAAGLCCLKLGLCSLWRQLRCAICAGSRYKVHEGKMPSAVAPGWHVPSALFLLHSCQSCSDLLFPRTQPHLVSLQALAC